MLRKHVFNIVLEIIGAITISTVILILLFGGEFSLKINFHSIIDLINHFKK